MPLKKDIEVLRSKYRTGSWRAKKLAGQPRVTVVDNLKLQATAKVLGAVADDLNKVLTKYQGEAKVE